ncbi:hypothetical protein [Pseudonocardia lacus]|uniref:hypothetical protein n=1 Tax=Pseudonocardia lacus TaxID=2835865 RepID=UPI001BDDB8EA|nr:hypothetical protein [Pseudonocardia lacus]
MTEVATLLAAASAGTVCLRAVFAEIRWWLALRGTTPTERPDIIRAMRSGPADSARRAVPDADGAAAP